MSVPCTQESKIDEIYNAIVGTLTEPGIRTLLSEMQHDQNEIKKTLYGNGKPGIVETVNNLRLQHEGEEKNWGKKVAIATLVLTNAAALIAPYLGKH